jgi:hypothetical protein
LSSVYYLVTGKLELVVSRCILASVAFALAAHASSIPDAIVHALLETSALAYDGMTAQC